VVLVYVIRLATIGVGVFVILLSVHTLVLYERAQHSRAERRRWAKDWIGSHVWRVAIATSGYVLASCYELASHLTDERFTWRTPAYLLLGVLLIDAVWRIHEYERLELSRVERR
jgi:hypothetical protein